MIITVLVRVKKYICKLSDSIRDGKVELVPTNLESLVQLTIRKFTAKYPDIKVDRVKTL